MYEFNLEQGRSLLRHAKGRIRFYLGDANACLDGYSAEDLVIRCHLSVYDDFGDSIPPETALDTIHSRINGYSKFLSKRARRSVSYELLDELRESPASKTIDPEVFALGRRGKAELVRRVHQAVVRRGKPGLILVEAFVLETGILSFGSAQPFGLRRWAPPPPNVRRIMRRLSTEPDFAKSVTMRFSPVSRIQEARDRSWFNNRKSDLRNIFRESAVGILGVDQVQAIELFNLAGKCLAYAKAA